MHRPRACLIAALVAVSAIAATTTTDAGSPPLSSMDSSMLEAGPEHARLTAMCGTWDLEMTFWFQPGGPGVTTKGTSTIRSLLGGLFVEEKIEGTLNGAPFTTLAWTGFNTATHQYEATRIASTNTIRIAETGGYDEKTRQFELKADYPFAGDTWHQRTVIQPASADAMTATSYLSFGKVPEWKGVEIKYTRRVISLMLSGPATAQAVVRSFDGDKGIDVTACDQKVMRCTRQPEPNVAADGSRVVQVTVNNVNVYDYRAKLLRSTPFRQFIRAAGLDPNPADARNEPSKGPFEPHAVFDKFIGRWIVTVTCVNDCFVVSASADPLGPWHGVYLSCLQGGPCLNFDPALHIGYDKNGVYYCGGHAHDEHPQTVPGYAYDCFAISGSEVKAIGDGREPEHLNRIHNLPLDILPAVDDNPHKSPHAPAFFAARTCSRAEPGGCQRSTNFSFQWIIDTFSWNGATGTYNVGGEQMVPTDIGSKQNKWLYNLPCCTKQATMAQKGSGIGLRAAESHRLINLVQYGTHLHGAMGSGPCIAACGEQGADANNVIFYVDFDCSNPAGCVVSQTAKIAGAEVNPVFGTVGVDQDGNVGIAALSSTAITDLSILLWTRRAADPPNMFRGPTVLAAGTQPYTCVNADNMALIASAVGILTVRDPIDGSKLWTTQQYGGDAKPCVWDTKVIEYRITPPPRRAP